MANEFHDDCAEASFRLSQIKMTDTTPPGRLTSFSKQLVLLLNMSARMHRSLDHIARYHSDSLTLASLSSMRDELSEISATRESFEEVAYKYLDALSQPSAVMGGDSVKEDSAVPVDEEEDLTTALESPDVAVNSAESFLTSIGKLFMALDNFVTTASRDHNSRLSNYEAKKVVVTSSITGLANISMTKERELLRYKLLLLMMSTTSNLGLLGQAASLKPRGEKDYKATRFKTTRLLNLQMISMMSSSRDMECFLMMRMLALMGLLLYASAHGPENKKL